MPDVTPRTTGPSGERSALPRGFSLYLDLLRFVAAATVLLSHSVDKATVGWNWWPSSLGHNAVIVFFVLSGCVIAYAADTKERSMRSFWLSRCARIYSVAVPALAVTLVADRIGLAIQPSFYDGGLTTHDYVLVRLAASLVFANELWLFSIMPFSNSPYWSLCYEVAYYALFSLWCFGGQRRVAWVLLAAFVIGPKILLLAPVWLLGVAVYRQRSWQRLAEPYCWMLWILSLAGIGIFQGLDITEGVAAWTHRAVGDWLDLRLHFSKRFIGDYLLAVLIAANFVGFRGIAQRFDPLLLALARAIRSCAGLTFSIYLYHLPLVFLAALLASGIEPGIGKLLLVASTAMGACVLLGQVTEHRRVPLRDWLAAQGPFRLPVPAPTRLPINDA